MMSYRQNTIELRRKIVQKLSSFRVELLGEVFYDAPPQREFAYELGLSRSSLQWHLRWLKNNGIIENRNYPKSQPLANWEVWLEKICNEPAGTQIPT